MGKKVVKFCCYADVPVFLWGERGVGKSQGVAQVAQELAEETGESWGFIDLRLATQEVSDLIGLPARDGNRTIWLMPEWFPTEPKSHGILFLDEMNRAMKDVIQAVFQLVLDKRLHTHILPPGWRIMAAGNYTDDYQVRDLDEAMMSRFLHINIAPEVSDVVKHFGKIGVTSRVGRFLTAQGTTMLLKIKGERHHYDPTPDPRRWEMVGKLVRAQATVPALTGMKDGEAKQLLQVALSGLVGMGAASAFKDFKDDSCSFEDILTGKAKMEGLKKPDFRRLSLEVVPTLQRVTYTEEMGNNLAAFVLKMEKDLGVKTCKEILKAMPQSEWSDSLRVRSEITEYFRFLFDQKQ
jgi:hypothetical protein